MQLYYYEISKIYTVREIKAQEEQGKNQLWRNVRDFP